MLKMGQPGSAPRANRLHNMNSIFYIIGVVVVVAVILKFLGVF
jgi:hypothetical protein